MPRASPLLRDLGSLSPRSCPFQPRPAKLVDRKGTSSGDRSIAPIVAPGNGGKAPIQHCDRSGECARPFAHFGAGDRSPKCRSRSELSADCGADMQRRQRRCFEAQASSAAASRSSVATMPALLWASRSSTPEIFLDMDWNESGMKLRLNSVTTQPSSMGSIS
jgi:hypothetical protein